MTRISHLLERMLDHLTPVPANLSLEIDIERLERELMDRASRRPEADASRNVELRTW